MDHKCFTGKTVFITGGASGIGRSSALAFARAGANVFIIDIDEAGGNAVVNEIVTAGGNAKFQATDVTIENDIIYAVEVCVQQFGSVDFAHNNAGIVISTTTVGCTEEIWNRVIDTNLKRSNKI